MDSNGIIKRNGCADVRFHNGEIGHSTRNLLRRKADLLFISTAKPGHLHVFDISKYPGKPELLKSIPAAEGAHHIAFTKDERFAFVQNSLLNLPGMSDGSITVVDLVKGDVIGSVNTLKDQGFNPNSIVLLPQWNHPAGH